MLSERQAIALPDFDSLTCDQYEWDARRGQFGESRALYQLREEMAEADRAFQPRHALTRLAIGLAAFSGVIVVLALIGRPS